MLYLKKWSGTMKSNKIITTMVLAAIVSANPVNAIAAPVLLEWSANLSVTAGNDGQLPSGVMDGDMIMGTIGWDTDNQHLVSHSNSGSTPEVANYDPDSWSLDLGGGNMYSRTVSDGLGAIGNGNIQIRNDDDTIADGLTLNDAFNFGNSLNPNAAPVNEYFFALRLIDDDRTVFEDFVFNGISLVPNLPDTIDGSLFEHTILSIFRIVEDPSNSRFEALLIGEADSLKSLAVSAVPVPAAIWLFGTALIGFVGMSRRRKVA
jgi:hypothetical protein